MANGKFAELGRVEAIRELFEGTGYEAFKEPCEYSVKGKKLAVATKLLTEGIDFNLKYFPLKHLGYKAVVEATGELFASLAKPRSLSVIMAVSSKLDFEDIQKVWEGVVSAAREYGYDGLTLELNPSLTGFAINVCATGETSMDKVAARSMDLVCVTGRLGAAFLGFQVLEKKFDQIEQYKMMVSAYLRPEISPNFVDQLNNGQIVPSWACLVTKGLSDAVLRMCRDTGLGAKIYVDKIPFEGNSISLSRELDIDPVSAAMNGGDDNLIMFTVPITEAERFRRDFQAYAIIGHLAQKEVGAALVTPEGVELPLRSQGWKTE